MASSGALKPEAAAAAADIGQPVTCSEALFDQCFASIGSNQPLAAPLEASCNSCFPQGQYAYFALNQASYSSSYYYSSSASSLSVPASSSASSIFSSEASSVVISSEASSSISSEVSSSSSVSSVNQCDDPGLKLFCGVTVRIDSVDTVANNVTMSQAQQRAAAQATSLAISVAALQGVKSAAIADYSQAQCCECEGYAGWPINIPACHPTSSVGSTSSSSSTPRSRGRSNGSMS